MRPKIIEEDLPTEVNNFFEICPKNEVTLCKMLYGVFSSTDNALLNWLRYLFEENGSNYELSKEDATFIKLEDAYHSEGGRVDFSIEVPKRKLKIIIEAKVGLSYPSFRQIEKYSKGADIWKPKIGEKIENKVIIILSNRVNEYHFQKIKKITEVKIINALWKDIPNKLKVKAPIVTVFKSYLKNLMEEGMLIDVRPYDGEFWIRDIGKEEFFIDSFWNYNLYHCQSAIFKNPLYFMPYFINPAKTVLEKKGLADFLGCKAYSRVFYVKIVDGKDYSSDDYKDGFDKLVKGVEIRPCYDVKNLHRKWFNGLCRLYERDNNFESAVYFLGPIRHIGKNIMKSSSIKSIQIPNQIPKGGIFKTLEELNVLMNSK